MIFIIFSETKQTMSGSPSGLGTCKKAFSGARVVWARGGTGRLSELWNMFFCCGFKGVGVRKMLFSCEISMFLHDLDDFRGKNIFSEAASTATSWEHFPEHPPARRGKRGKIVGKHVDKHVQKSEREGGTNVCKN